jgi:hypothetical protein
MVPLRETEDPLVAVPLFSFCFVCFFLILLELLTWESFLFFGSSSEEDETPLLRDLAPALFLKVLLLVTTSRLMMGAGLTLVPSLASSYGTFLN